MRALSYLRPDSLATALEALSEDPQAKLLAGGQSLLPALKLRLAAPSRLIDLQGIAELRGVSMARHLRIGAMTTHADVARHPDVCRLLPALAALAGGIGDRMVRNLGTLGGSIANNDPAADYPAALVGFNAVVVTTSRRVAASEFFRGLYETALDADEVVIAVEFPVARRAAYVKFKNPASRFALVGVLVAETDEGPRVVVTGAASIPFRVPAYEQALSRNFAAQALEGVVTEFGELNSDLHASAEYRAHLIPEITRRAAAQAVRVINRGE